MAFLAVAVQKTSGMQTPPRKRQDIESLQGATMMRVGNDSPPPMRGVRELDRDRKYTRDHGCGMLVEPLFFKWGSGEQIDTNGEDIETVRDAKKWIQRSKRANPEGATYVHLIDKTRVLEDGDIACGRIDVVLSHTTLPIMCG
jgi:hypothetical protein